MIQVCYAPARAPFPSMCGRHGNRTNILAAVTCVDCLRSLVATFAGAALRRGESTPVPSAPALARRRSAA